MTSPFVDRRGQVFAITGAAGGIGAAIARRAHAEGAELVLIDLDPRVEELAAAFGDRASACVADIADPGAWDPIVDGHKLEVLVNSAGVLGPQGPVTETTVEDWERVMRVNLTGTFIASRAVLPTMIAAKKGWIVNLASIGGKEGNAGQAPYCSSKGGVIALTKSVAKEVADHGIIVNCVAPTVVEGPFSDEMEDWRRAAILSKIPMGRFTRADEVAATVSWMSSPGCSFTTGFCFDVTGGRATY